MHTSKGQEVFDAIFRNTNRGSFKHFGPTSLGAVLARLGTEKKGENSETSSDYTVCAKLSWDHDVAVAVGVVRFVLFAVFAFSSISLPLNTMSSFSLHLSRDLRDGRLRAYFSSLVSLRSSSISGEYQSPCVSSSSSSDRCVRCETGSQLLKSGPSVYER